MGDAFSRYHPAVCFGFFVGAVGCGVLLQHPIYLLISAVAGAVYYLLLKGRRGIRVLLGLVPVFIFLSAINPLLNLYGEHILFTVFGRPYTWEALCYGMALAGTVCNMLLWFGCWNVVLTGDKLTSLFGNLLPAISLLLVMVMRMVPGFMRKTRQIMGARKSIGKGAGENASLRQKLNDGLTVLGTLTGWALEGGVVTGDSMRARGYGAAKRTSFQMYAFGRKDGIFAAVLTVLLSALMVAVCMGQTAAEFTPVLSIAPVSWGTLAYGGFLLLPSLLQIKENLLWHISKSGI